MQEKLTTRELLAVLGITFAAFVFNTSEFMPIGLLTDIAETFSLTEAEAGVMMTVYSWAVMILSIPLMLLAARLPQKLLVLVTVALFSAGQLCTAAAPAFIMLIASRLMVAAAHAVFWAIAIPMVIEVVRPECRSKAVSVVVTGTSVAMIVGLPLGRVVGIYIGWRTTFTCVGIAGILIILYLFFCFPRVKASSVLTFRDVGTLLHNRSVLAICALNFLTICGYYTAYSYIEPFMLYVAGISDNIITAALIGFGVCGILGSNLFSHFYDRQRYRFMAGCVIGITLSLWLLHAASHTVVTSILLCGFWGVMVTAYNATYQSEIIKACDEKVATIAMASFSAIYNLGIGTGTAIGGQVTTHLGLKYIGYTGGSIGVVAILFCILVLIRQLKRAEAKAS